jgi:hypothetical protein
MKDISEPKALVQLRRAKQGFAEYINRNYAFKAKDCRACSTVCCADADFVNVNITRLEAEAIWRALKNSSRVTPEKFAEIFARARVAIEKYHLASYGDTFQQTYSCPLFEPGIGCLVHWKAKPSPCIQHGCYDDWHDLPDTAEFSRVERRVEQLNERVYGSEQDWQYATIPIWLARIDEEMRAVQLREDKSTMKLREDKSAMELREDKSAMKIELETPDDEIS